MAPRQRGQHQQKKKPKSKAVTLKRYDTTSNESSAEDSSSNWGTEDTASSYGTNSSLLLGPDAAAKDQDGVRLYDGWSDSVADTPEPEDDPSWLKAVGLASARKNIREKRIASTSPGARKLGLLHLLTALYLCLAFVAVAGGGHSIVLLIAMLTVLLPTKIIRPAAEDTERFTKEIEDPTYEQEGRLFRESAFACNEHNIHRDLFQYRKKLKRKHLKIQKQRMDDEKELEKIRLWQEQQRAKLKQLEQEEMDQDNTESGGVGGYGLESGNSGGNKSSGVYDPLQASMRNALPPAFLVSKQSGGLSVPNEPIGQMEETGGAGDWGGSHRDRYADEDFGAHNQPGPEGTNRNLFQTPSYYPFEHDGDTADARPADTPSTSSVHIEKRKKKKLVVGATTRLVVGESNVYYLAARWQVGAMAVYCLLWIVAVIAIGTSADDPSSELYDTYNNAADRTARSLSYYLNFPFQEKARRDAIAAQLATNAPTASAVSTTTPTATTSGTTYTSTATTLTTLPPPVDNTTYTDYQMNYFYLFSIVSANDDAVRFYISIALMAVLLVQSILLFAMLPKRTTYYEPTLSRHESALRDRHKVLIVDTSNIGNASPEAAAKVPSEQASATATVAPGSEVVYYDSHETAAKAASEALHKLRSVPPYVDLVRALNRAALKIVSRSVGAQFVCVPQPVNRRLVVTRISLLFLASTLATVILPSWLTVIQALILLVIISTCFMAPPDVRFARAPIQLETIPGELRPRFMKSWFYEFDPETDRATFIRGLGISLMYYTTAAALFCILAFQNPVFEGWNVYPVFMDPRMGVSSTNVPSPFYHRVGLRNIYSYASLRPKTVDYANSVYWLNLTGSATEAPTTSTTTTSATNATTSIANIIVAPEVPQDLSDALDVVRSDNIFARLIVQLVFLFVTLLLVRGTPRSFYYVVIPEYDEDARFVRQLGRLYQKQVQLIRLYPSLQLTDDILLAFNSLAYPVAVVREESTRPDADDRVEGQAPSGLQGPRKGSPDDSMDELRNVSMGDGGGGGGGYGESFAREEDGGVAGSRFSVVLDTTGGFDMLMGAGDAAIAEAATPRRRASDAPYPKDAHNSGAAAHHHQGDHDDGDDVGDDDGSGSTEDYIINDQNSLLTRAGSFLSTAMISAVAAAHRALFRFSPLVMPIAFVVFACVSPSLVTAGVIIPLVFGYCFAGRRNKIVVLRVLYVVQVVYFVVLLVIFAGELYSVVDSPYLRAAVIGSKNLRDNLNISITNFVLGIHGTCLGLTVLTLMMFASSSALKDESDPDHERLEKRTKANFIDQDARDIFQSRDISEVRSYAQILYRREAHLRNQLSVHKTVQEVLTHRKQGISAKAASLAAGGKVTSSMVSDRLLNGKHKLTGERDAPQADPLSDVVKVGDLIGFRRAQALAELEAEHARTQGISSSLEGTDRSLTADPVEAEWPNMSLRNLKVYISDKEEFNRRRWRAQALVRANMLLGPDAVLKITALYECRHEENVGRAHKKLIEARAKLERLLMKRVVDKYRGSFGRAEAAQLLLTRELKGVTAAAANASGRPSVSNSPEPSPKGGHGPLDGGASAANATAAAVANWRGSANLDLFNNKSLFGMTYKYSNLGLDTPRESFFVGTANSEGLGSTLRDALAENHHKRNPWDAQRENREKGREERTSMLPRPVFVTAMDTTELEEVEMVESAGSGENTEGDTDGLAPLMSPAVVSAPTAKHLYEQHIPNTPDEIAGYIDAYLQNSRWGGKKLKGRLNDDFKADFEAIRTKVLPQIAWRLTGSELLIILRFILYFVPAPFNGDYLKPTSSPSSSGPAAAVENSESFYESAMSGPVRMPKHSRTATAQYASPLTTTVSPTSATLGGTPFGEPTLKDQLQKYEGSPLMETPILLDDLILICACMKAGAAFILDRPTTIREVKSKSALVRQIVRESGAVNPTPSPTAQHTTRCMPSPLLYSTGFQPLGKDPKSAVFITPYVEEADEAELDVERIEEVCLGDISEDASSTTASPRNASMQRRPSVSSFHGSNRRASARLSHRSPSAQSKAAMLAREYNLGDPPAGEALMAPTFTYDTQSPIDALGASMVNLITFRRIEAKMTTFRSKMNEKRERREAAIIKAAELQKAKAAAAAAAAAKPDQPPSASLSARQRRLSNAASSSAAPSPRSYLFPFAISPKKGTAAPLTENSPRGINHPVVLDGSSLSPQRLAVWSEQREQFSSPLYARIHAPGHDQQIAATDHSNKKGKHNSSSKKLNSASADLNEEGVWEGFLRLLLNLRLWIWNQFLTLQTLLYHLLINTFIVLSVVGFCVTGYRKQMSFLHIAALAGLLGALWSQLGTIAFQKSVLIVYMGISMFLVVATIVGSALRSEFAEVSALDSPLAGFGSEPLLTTIGIGGFEKTNWELLLYFLQFFTVYLQWVEWKRVARISRARADLAHIYLDEEAPDSDDEDDIGIRFQECLDYNSWNIDYDEGGDASQTAIDSNKHNGEDGAEDGDFITHVRGLDGKIVTVEVRRIAEFVSWVDIKAWVEWRSLITSYFFIRAQMYFCILAGVPAFVALEGFSQPTLLVLLFFIFLVFIVVYSIRTNAFETQLLRATWFAMAILGTIVLLLVVGYQVTPVKGALYEGFGDLYDLNLFVGTRCGRNPEIEESTTLSAAERRDRTVQFCISEFGLRENRGKITIVTILAPWALLVVVACMQFATLTVYLRYTTHHRMFNDRKKEELRTAERNKRQEELMRALEQELALKTIGLEMDAVKKHLDRRRKFVFKSIEDEDDPSTRRAEEMPFAERLVAVSVTIIRDNMNKLCLMAYIYAALQTPTLTNSVYILFFVVDLKGWVPMMYAIVHLIAVYAYPLSFFPSYWDAEGMNWVGVSKLNLLESASERAVRIVGPLLVIIASRVYIYVHALSTSERKYRLDEKLRIERILREKGYFASKPPSHLVPIVMTSAASPSSATIAGGAEGGNAAVASTLTAQPRWSAKAARRFCRKYRDELDEIHLHQRFTPEELALLSGNSVVERRARPGGIDDSDDGVEVGNNDLAIRDGLPSPKRAATKLEPSPFRLPTTTNTANAGDNANDKGNGSAPTPTRKEAPESFVSIFVDGVKIVIHYLYDLVLVVYHELAVDFGYELLTLALLIFMSVNSIRLIQVFFFVTLSAMIFLGRDYVVTSKWFLTTNIVFYCVLLVAMQFFSIGLPVQTVSTGTIFDSINVLKQNANFRYDYLRYVGMHPDYALTWCCALTVFLFRLVLAQAPFVDKKRRSTYIVLGKQFTNFSEVLKAFERQINLVRGSLGDLDFLIPTGKISNNARFPYPVEGLHSITGPHTEPLDEDGNPIINTTTIDPSDLEEITQLLHARKNTRDGRIRRRYLDRISRLLMRQEMTKLQRYQNPRTTSDLVVKVFGALFITPFAMFLDGVTGSSLLHMAVVAVAVWVLVQRQYVFWYCFRVWPKVIWFYLGILFTTMVCNIPTIAKLIENHPSAPEALGLAGNKAGAYFSDGSDPAVPVMTISALRVIAIWLCVLQLRMFNSFSFLMELLSIHHSARETATKHADLRLVLKLAEEREELKAEMRREARSRTIKKLKVKNIPTEATAIVVIDEEEPENGASGNATDNAAEESKKKLKSPVEAIVIDQDGFDQYGNYVGAPEPPKTVAENDTAGASAIDGADEPKQPSPAELEDQRRKELEQKRRAEEKAAQDKADHEARVKHALEIYDSQINGGGNLKDSFLKNIFKKKKKALNKTASEESDEYEHISTNGDAASTRPPTVTPIIFPKSATTEVFDPSKPKPLLTQDRLHAHTKQLNDSAAASSAPPPPAAGISYGQPPPPPPPPIDKTGNASNQPPPPPPPLLPLPPNTPSSVKSQPQTQQKKKVGREVDKEIDELEAEAALLSHRSGGSLSNRLRRKVGRVVRYLAHHHTYDEQIPMRSSHVFIQLLVTIGYVIARYSAYICFLLMTINFLQSGSMYDGIVVILMLTVGLVWNPWAPRRFYMGMLWYIGVGITLKTFIRFLSDAFTVNPHQARIISGFFLSFAPNDTQGAAPSELTRAADSAVSDVVLDYVCLVAVIIHLHLCEVFGAYKTDISKTIAKNDVAPLSEESDASVRTVCSTATDDEILLSAAQAQARAKALRTLRRVTRKQMQSERRALIINQRKMAHFLSQIETPEEADLRRQRDEECLEDLRRVQAMHLQQLESEGTYEAFLAADTRITSSTLSSSPKPKGRNKGGETEPNASDGEEGGAYGYATSHPPPTALLAGTGDDDNKPKKTLSQIYRNVMRVFGTGKDLYLVTFAWEWVGVLFGLIFIYAIMGRTTGSVVQSIDTNLLPGALVGMLLLFVLVMVADRSLYVMSSANMRRAMAGKFYLHVALTLFYVIFYCIWVNSIAKEYVGGGILMIIKVGYLFLAAFQLRVGFPRFRTHDPFSRSLDTPEVIYRAYKAIPFLWDLRMYLDWSFTRTALSFEDFLKVEDCHHEVLWRYLKHDGYSETNPRRGTLHPWKERVTGAGIMVIAILLIIFFPLMYFSTANPRMQANQLTLATSSVSFEGHGSVFSSTVYIPDGSPVDQRRKISIRQLYPDLDKQEFFTDRNYQFVQMESCSSGLWSMSPSGLERFLNETSYVMSFSLSLTRSEAVASDKSIDTVQGRTLDAEQTARMQAMVRHSLMIPDNASLADPALLPPPVILTGIYDPFVRNTPSTIQPFSELSSFPSYNIDCQLSLETVSNSYSGTPLWVRYWCFKCRSLFESGNNPYAPTYNGTDRECATTDSGCENYDYQNPNSPSSQARTMSTDGVYIVASSDQVPSPLSLIPSDTGIIALYTTFVLALASVVRNGLEGSMFRIVVEECHDPKCLEELITYIYLSRGGGDSTKGVDLVLEEQLFFELMDLLRSPEELKKRSGNRADTYDAEGDFIPLEPMLEW